jgi:hypothetical protein
MPVKYSEKKPSSTGPNTFEIAMTLEKMALITTSLAEILRPCRQRRRDDRLVETGMLRLASPVRHNNSNRAFDGAARMDERGGMARWQDDLYDLLRRNNVP